MNNLEAAEITKAESLEAEPMIKGGKIECAAQKEINEVSAMQNSSQTRVTGIPSVRSTWELRKRATRFLCGKLTHAEGIHSVEAGQAFAMEWFIKYGRFLL